MLTQFLREERTNVDSKPRVDRRVIIKGDDSCLGAKGRPGRKGQKKKPPKNKPKSIEKKIVGKKKHINPRVKNTRQKPKIKVQSFKTNDHRS